jgi:hypothetical protein
MTLNPSNSREPGLAFNPNPKDIMALKTKDGTLEPKPTNYERDSQAAGINFQLPGQRQLFAPYSFLSHAQMNREEEIVFHYSFGTVRVKGEHLAFIYSLVRVQELGSINCASDEAAKPDDPRIREIVVEKSGDDQDRM